MKQLIKKKYCWLFGHKRGKRIAIVSGVAQYECGRCKAQWHRKAPKLKAVA